MSGAAGKGISVWTGGGRAAAGDDHEETIPSDAAERGGWGQ